MGREDDSSIRDEVDLFRRIHPDHHLHWDYNLGCRRVTSGAFDDPELSVVLGDTLAELRREPITILDRFEGEFLVRFTAGTARGAQQRVCRDSDPDEEAHGLVVGRKTGATKRALREASLWVVQPGDACESPGGSAVTG